MKKDKKQKENSKQSNGQVRIGKIPKVAEFLNVEHKWLKGIKKLEEHTLLLCLR
jgi:hypothetical protein